MTSERSHRKSPGTRHEGHTHVELEPSIDTALALRCLVRDVLYNQPNLKLTPLHSPLIEWKGLAVQHSQRYHC